MSVFVGFLWCVYRGYLSRQVSSQLRQEKTGQWRGLGIKHCWRKQLSGSGNWDWKSVSLFFASFCTISLLKLLCCCLSLHFEVIRAWPVWKSGRVNSPILVSHYAVPLISLASLWATLKNVTVATFLFSLCVSSKISSGVLWNELDFFVCLAQSVCKIQM